MAEFYLPIKHTHLLFVALSVVLFSIRGLASIAGAAWLQNKWLKIAPHIIDTLMLMTGVMLMITIQQYPGVTNWLTVKILLLVGYILLGVKAIKSEQRSKKISYFIAALAIVVFIASVAVTKNPLGLFSSI